MNAPEMGGKTALRAEIRALLRGVPAEERNAASARARALLLQQPAWREASSILFYAPLSDELDLLPLAATALSEGKVAALPRYVEGNGEYLPSCIRDEAADLVRGRFGILEPSAACEAHSIKQLDLILVPGLAFGRNGGRLGRGKGFYDRLLASARGLKCGAALNCQVKDELPLEPHDILVNCILTPEDWLVCPSTPVLK